MSGWTQLGLLTAAGVLGGVLTQVGNVVNDRLTTRREREARNEERADRRHEMAARFEHETLLQLQEAMQRLLVRTTEAHEGLRTAGWPDLGHGQRRRYGPNPTESIEALAVVGKFRSRIADEVLRELAERLEQQHWQLLNAPTEGEAASALTLSIKLFQDASKRAGELLPPSFEP